MLAIQFLNLALQLTDPVGWREIAVPLLGALLFVAVLLRPRRMRKRIEALSSPEC
ncbi:hypothetical protein HNR71_005283 [Kribbella sandramycini]|uniref:Uncharacterized protein n=1 Tax=Kribbella sandramycini TaxID=60450 RepID=A0A841SNQ3_9ACTN|nr:hypothetical protein [Kribbella sandramycini]